MSVQLQYFFNSELALPELATAVNRALGFDLEPYQGDDTDYFAKFLGIEFSLDSDHDLANDGDADFESFRYCLDLRTSAGASGRRPIQLPLLLAVVHTLQHDFGYTGMAVHETHIVLARYEERGVHPNRRYVDVLSGTSPDDYESHLHAVRGRCPM